MPRKGAFVKQACPPCPADDSGSTSAPARFQHGHARGDVGLRDRTPTATPCGLRLAIGLLGLRRNSCAEPKPTLCGLDGLFAGDGFHGRCGAVRALIPFGQRIKESLQSSHAGATGAANFQKIQPDALVALRAPPVQRADVDLPASAAVREPFRRLRKGEQLFLGDIDHRPPPFP